MAKTRSNVPSEAIIVAVDDGWTAPEQAVAEGAPPAQPESTSKLTVFEQAGHDQRLAELTAALQGSVSPEVSAVLIFVSGIALAATRMGINLQKEVEEMKARNRKAAACLSGDEVAISGENKGERVPEKLKKIEVQLPESIDLAKGSLDVQLENPNEEPVRVGVEIWLEDVHGDTDPVLKAVVNPFRRRNSDELISNPVVLQGREKKTVRVDIIAKLGLAKVTDIIAERLVLTVTSVVPVSPNSNSLPRNEPYEISALVNVVDHLACTRNFRVTAPSLYGNSSRHRANYRLELPGVTFNYTTIDLIPNGNMILGSRYDVTGKFPAKMENTGLPIIVDYVAHVELASELEGSEAKVTPLD